MTVFLDAVGLLALWDESDQWHKAAQACFLKLLSGRVDLITSSFVLLECGNAAARRPYRSAVSRLRAQMETGNRLVTPTVEDWQAAWLAYERREADNAGIVDHTSFSIMRRLGISQAFTNDNHFRAAKFETLF
jgi:predicted nucleic acid-binding protein